MPGEDAPERVIFEQLKMRNWLQVAQRVGRDHAAVADASQAMLLQNHHDWINAAATNLVLGGDILWQALCAEWAANCLEKDDAKKIVQPIEDALIGGGCFYFSDRCQRDSAAFRAMTDLCFGDRTVALAVPPFKPPTRRFDGLGWRFDSLTVSSVSPVAISTMSFASWFGSRGRLGMTVSCHIPRPPASAGDFKLRHYLFFNSLAFPKVL